MFQKSLYSRLFDCKWSTFFVPYVFVLPQSVQMPLSKSLLLPVLLPPDNPNHFDNLAVYLKEDVSGKASFARYTDKAQLSGEYSDSFAWAIKNHIILTTSKKMTPNGNVTRGDLARMLYRFDIFAD